RVARSGVRGRHLQSTTRTSDVIEGVNQVIVEVDDQDRALKFSTETIGFELVEDSPYPGTGRWIEVRTRDKATILVLHIRESDPPTAPEHLLLLRGSTARVRRATRARSRIPPTARPPELGLVVDVRGR